MPTLCVEWIHKHTECLQPILASAKEFRVEGFCVLSHIIEIVRNCQVPQAEGQTPHFVQPVVVLRQVYQYVSFSPGRATENRRWVKSPKTYEGVRSNSRDVI